MLRVRNLLDLDLPLNFLAERGPNLLGRRTVLEIYLHQRSTIKVNAVFRPTLDDQTAQSQGSERQRGDDERPFIAEKVKVRLLEDFHRASQPGIYYR